MMKTFYSSMNMSACRSISPCEGPLEIAGGGDLVKSPGEPEGRILGELEWP